MTPCHTPTPLRMATICSGIGAPEVASIGLPFEHVFMAEIEPFPSAVLAHHWPHVPNLGDMTKVDGAEYNGDVDILVGGTPCQAFSVAGKRESLSDERGNLTLKFVELCDAINPAFVLWENVPGVLSTADNAFGCFLGALSGNDGELFPAGDGWSNAGCVIGPRRKLAWRILDAQYFGLAQRRRRVFVVACPRDGADPCEVLFEREGVQRHSAPSREKGEGFAGVAGTLFANRGGLDRPAGNANELDFCVPVTGSHWEGGAHPSLNQSNNTGGIGMSNQELSSQKGAGLVPAVMAHGQGNAEIVSDGDPSLTCNHEAPIAFHPTQDPIHSADGSCHALGCGSGGGQATHAVAFAQNQLGEVRTGAIANTLNTNFNASGRNTPCVCFGGDVARTLQARHDSSPCADRGMDVVAFHQNQRAEVTLNDTAGSLKVGGGKPGQGYPAVMCSNNMGDFYASTQEANARTILRLLREEIGEEAFTEWGLGILVSFYPQEILRSAVHGKGIRCPSIEEFGLVNYALSREEDRSTRAVQYLRSIKREGCPPFGWRPHEQRSKELATYLSELSRPGTSGTQILRDMWAASQGTGLLRETLSAIQEMGRPDCGERQPAYAMQVRRLVCEECEFLQGFPRNYTRIPWRKGKLDAFISGKDCPDGPRYKALGNSMAVPVIRWILRRIADAE
ncbi:MAG: DNA cytosine methyltransferase [Desulfomicrobium apsheronum]|nr:DNA cytosine methyltransferase [Desulfomicrobium apsheronum]